ncbi:MAG: hypothetical protein EOM23_12195, partial [Candidatus Moranbacteria bacterium]|nr:hypothetical protein [Candidatus Moranbacteria bacterium]
MFDFEEVIPGRNLNPTYIYFDIVFLILFLGLLAYRKRYLTILFAISGGILYFLVDYGFFYLILGTRVIEGASYFWFLLWLSMSYGITNFAWIWLWIRKDQYLVQWSFIILIWWFICPFLAKLFGGEFGAISIYRGTSGYPFRRIDESSGRRYRRNGTPRGEGA